MNDDKITRSESVPQTLCGTLWASPAALIKSAPLIAVDQNYGAYYRLLSEWTRPFLDATASAENRLKTAPELEPYYDVLIENLRRWRPINHDRAWPSGYFVEQQETLFVDGKIDLVLATQLTGDHFNYPEKLGPSVPPPVMRWLMQGLADFWKNKDKTLDECLGFVQKRGAITQVFKDRGNEQYRRDLALQMWLLIDNGLNKGQAAQLAIARDEMLTKFVGKYQLPRDVMGVDTLINRWPKLKTDFAADISREYERNPKYLSKRGLGSICFVACASAADYFNQHSNIETPEPDFYGEDFQYPLDALKEIKKVKDSKFKFE